jgi:lipopolysaccharide/colanic/teichoic acid biosynthesis glycosyltransferase
MGKRLFDLGFAITALAVLIPFFLFLALWIKLDSRGPVIYSATRCGLGKKPFRFYKFRTMVAGADKTGNPLLTVPTDARVTRLGRYLRLFKLDELPQLINVLKGDMSVVGPRPEVPDIVEKHYPEKWVRVLTVKPGLTCLLQTLVYPDCTYAYPPGLTDPMQAYLQYDLPFKLDRDIDYVEKASFGLDLTIILKTLHRILFKNWRFLKASKPADPTGDPGTDHVSR